jgi:hypothetical protein
MVENSEMVLAQLSENHLRILHHVLRGGEIDTMARRTLSHYASDRYARGVRLDEAVDQIIDRLFDIHWTVPEVQALNIARSKFKLRESIGYRTVLKHIGKLGYETKFTLKRKLARSWNQALLMAEPPRRGFMSATWGERQLSFEADLLIALVTNEVPEEYDLMFIYDEIKKYKNADALMKSIRSRELYLDPTYEMELDGKSYSVLKELKETIPDTKLPPMAGFV